MENLASFQEISHKSYLLRISLSYWGFFAERFACICSCWNISEVQVMVNESGSSSHDLCVKLHVCMYYNAS